MITFDKVPRDQEVVISDLCGDQPKLQSAAAASTDPVVRGALLALALSSQGSRGAEERQARLERLKIKKATEAAQIEK